MTRRQFLSTAGAAALAVTGGRLFRWPAQPTAILEGQILASGSGALANARVTLFTPGLSFFREARSNIAGQYTLSAVPAGTYQLGSCALGREYQEITVTIAEPGVTRNFTLGPDIHPGAWAVVGSTAPEVFGGTNSGSLLADGRIFYCHDATDPIVFNPVTGQTFEAAHSTSEQGCHMPTHLLDGRLLLVGGGTVDDAGNFSPGERAGKVVKAYNPASNTWENWPDLNAARWYPGLARLANGRLLLFGGGQQPDAVRTASCEILDPRTRQSTPTGSMLKAGGFGPALLLRNGEVLVTWDPPQIYNLISGKWRAAGPFVQPLRATVESCPLPRDRPAGQVPFVGDHPDHTALYLPDGRVVALGLRRTALGDPGSTVEFYDPEVNSCDVVIATLWCPPTLAAYLLASLRHEQPAGRLCSAWRTDGVNSGRNGPLGAGGLASRNRHAAYLWQRRGGRRAASALSPASSARRSMERRPM